MNVPDIPLPEGFVFGQYADMLVIQNVDGYVSIDLRRRKYALGLTTIMPLSMTPVNGRGWQRILIANALESLKTAIAQLHPKESHGKAPR